MNLNYYVSFKHANSDRITAEMGLFLFSCEAPENRLKVGDPFTIKFCFEDGISAPEINELCFTVMDINTTDVAGSYVISVMPKSKHTSLREIKQMLERFKEKPQVDLGLN